MKEKIKIISIFAIFLMLSMPMISNIQAKTITEKKEECSICSAKDSSGRPLCKWFNMRLNSLERKIRRYMRNPYRIFLIQIIIIQNSCILYPAIITGCWDVVNKMLSEDWPDVPDYDDPIKNINNYSIISLIKENSSNIL